ncbi:O-methyltransferase involved in polyketide biosynthesis [Mycobacterium sp. MAA66]|uniref:class I SAM-dependent methyltransferase n=1 Tax=Mycobacterium sp. MAA66 TaxID=3156297 RepID=UPI003516F13D
MTTIDGSTLEGVSATTLWTLHNRASEAKRRDGSLEDPYAVALFDTIDYDYLKFGNPNQSHALRAKAFDAAATVYLRTHPNASVVALAEGLQTSFWRLQSMGLADNLRWYSVDLPAVVTLREQLLPPDDRITALAQSALDFSWMDQVDGTDGAFITAEGLLMYLEPDDVRALIAACATRFPGGQLMFDSIPTWLSDRTLKGWKLSERYTAPPMPFGVSPDEAIAMALQIPGVVAARDVPHMPGRGVFKLFSSPTLDRLGVFHRNRPSMTLVTFG